MDCTPQANLSYADFINFSFDDAALVLQEVLFNDHIFDHQTEALLVVCYATLMALGLISNLAVACVILCNARIRTSRNLFIVNLSVSDLALCLFCMPFTLLELVRKSWPLGSVLCKLVPFVQGATVFVSAATVSAIAVDRHLAIVRTGPSQTSTTHKEKWLPLMAFLIWASSLMLSLPLCFFQTIKSVGLPGIRLYHKCIEQWPSSVSKGVYTGVVMAMQFVIPAFLLAVTHMGIRRHLNSARKSSERLQRDLRRHNRATMVLLSISVLFAASWLPWNILNLVADLKPNWMSPENLYLSFAACHLIAMSSAVSNPILYGWLNANVRHELTRLGRKATSVFHKFSFSNQRSASTPNLNTSSISQCNV